MSFESENDVRCPKCRHIERREPGLVARTAYDDGVQDICPVCAVEKLIELGVPVMIPIDETPKPKLIKS